LNYVLYSCIKIFGFTNIKYTCCRCVKTEPTQTKNCEKPFVGLDVLNGY